MGQKDDYHNQAGAGTFNVRGMAGATSFSRNDCEISIV